MISGVNEQCPNDAMYLIVTSQKDKEGKFKPFNRDVFCEDDAYRFSMYYSNYLGLRVIIKRLKVTAEKVNFT